MLTLTQYTIHTISYSFSIWYRINYNRKTKNDNVNVSQSYPTTNETPKSVEIINYHGFQSLMQSTPPHHTISPKQNRIETKRWTRAWAKPKGWAKSTSKKKWKKKTNLTKWKDNVGFLLILIEKRNRVMEIYWLK